MKPKRKREPRTTVWLTRQQLAALRMLASGELSYRQFSEASRRDAEQAREQLDLALGRLCRKPTT